MAASSSSSSSSAPSRTWKYDVFPSFRGEDVRQTFLSHLLEKLDSKLITTFIDNGIERSRLIAPELFSAIEESRISIVIFSKKYASSTWCLDELEAIYNRFKDQMDQMDQMDKMDQTEDQMVIPVFYEVDPSHVRKQTGEFGDIFKMTCEGKSDKQKQSWTQALTQVAKIAGFDSQKWENEAAMIEQISKDVFKKLFTPLDDFRDFVGIDTHLEAMNSKYLCLESGEVKMVGIVGTSGIGKSSIARALFDRLKSRFHRHAFVSYKRNIHDKIKADYEIRLSWANQFLSDILGIEVKIDSVGMVEQKFKHQKVLVVLDDVDEIELLETLVGDTTWFGYGSRIIVVTQDKSLLKSHGIDLIYEVPIPSQEVALEMFCRSALKQKSRDGFMELAVEVAKAAGNLPLGLNVLGSSLRGKDKKEWVEMMPMIQGGLDGKIGKILEICYKRLDSKDDQELFLYIACLFNGESVSYISNLLEGVYTSVITRLRMLADKSLIRISTPEETVEMHIMLEKLGRGIVRQESVNDPGKRRFLVELGDIRKVLTNKTGTDNVLGICLDVSNISGPLFIDENAFEGMCNLQFIKFYGTVSGSWWSVKEIIWKSNRGLVYLPPKLRLLHWEKYPWKYIPSNFKAECLVKLVIKDSKLTRLWRGTLPLENLKSMDLSLCKNLKEIPDLSKATKLKKLNMSDCESLEVLPTDVNLVSLEVLILSGCEQLRSFPQISTNIRELYMKWCKMVEEVPPWIENMSKLKELNMRLCRRLKNISPSMFKLRHLRKANFSSCDELTSFSDASVVATVACIIDSLDFPSNDLKDFQFNECFNLDRNAQELLLVLPIPMFTILPIPIFTILLGEVVPTYFTHRSRESFLTLPQSSPSLEVLRFKACVVIGSSDHDDWAIKLKVRWRFRGLSGVKLFDTNQEFYERDHMLVFNFDFEPNSHLSASAAIDHKSSQSELDNIMEFEVSFQVDSDIIQDLIDEVNKDFFEDFFSSEFKMGIKGCGIKLLNASLR